MKKMAIFLLILTLCVSICACEKAEKGKKDPKETTYGTASGLTTNPTNSTSPADPANPGDSSNTNAPNFQSAEEAARSFVVAFHRNDAEAMMRQTPDFENDAILRYLEIDVPAGADKEALLIGAWKSMLPGESAPDRQIDVTTTFYTGDDAEEIIADVKNNFIAHGYATEEDLAGIEEVVLASCEGVPAGDSYLIITADVYCMKIDGHWYTSYIGSSINPHTTA